MGNTIYIIRVFANNYEEYEDHFEWDFNYKAFNTKEKAEIWLTNVEEYIEEIYRYDIATDYPELPISFEKIDNIHGKCAYDIWIGDEESSKIHRWDKHCYQFVIEEMEVE